MAASSICNGQSISVEHGRACPPSIRLLLTKNARNATAATLLCATIPSTCPRLRDLVLTQVLCVVGSSWVGIAAGLGRAQALTWIAAMVLFYLPMAVSVIYLNREMPLEGGLYVWARTAFGDLGGV